MFPSSQNPWDARYLGSRSGGTDGNVQGENWQPETGFNNETQCFNSSNCGAGYYCDRGRCKKITAPDESAPNATVQSPTSGGGCTPVVGTPGASPTAGSGAWNSPTSNGGTTSSNCGSSTGGGSGCTSATCSNTGGSGINNPYNPDPDCGEECCRNVGGTVQCRPGKCPDDPLDPDNPGNFTGKPCDSFCANYQASNGNSFSSSCSSKECSECSTCGDSGTCEKKTSGACHCDNSGASCGGAQSCNKSTGNCDPVDDRTRSYYECWTGLPKCARGRGIYASGRLGITACGSNDTERAKSWNEQAAKICKELDRNDGIDRDGKCRYRTGSRSGVGSCPSGFTCQATGAITDESTGEVIYFWKECPKPDPDDPDDDVPELDGDEGTGWPEWWSRTCVGDGSECGIGQICASGPGQIPGAKPGCYQDPAFPNNYSESTPGGGGDNDTGEDGGPRDEDPIGGGSGKGDPPWDAGNPNGDVCPDGTVCSPGGGCYEVREGQWGCCRDSVTPKYRTKSTYPNGDDGPTLSSYGGPASVGISDLCAYGCGWQIFKPEPCGVGDRPAKRPLLKCDNCDFKADEDGISTPRPVDGIYFRDCYCGDEDRGCGEPSFGGPEWVGNICHKAS